MESSLKSLNRALRSVESTAEATEAGLRDLKQEVRDAQQQAGGDQTTRRIATMVALEFVNSTLVPGAKIGHPQVQSCVKWLVDLEGSPSDCGLVAQE